MNLSNGQASPDRATSSASKNAGRVPLVMGAGFFRPGGTILDFARKQVRHLDFEYYHVMPYHPLLSFERLEWFYRHIADRVAKPLWLYTSANWSKPFTPDFAAKLKDHPNIAGIKFSTKDAVAVSRVCALQDESFQVITAVASQLFPCLCMGTGGHTSSLGFGLPRGHDRDLPVSSGRTKWTRPGPPRKSFPVPGLLAQGGQEPQLPPGGSRRRPSWRPADLRSPHQLVLRRTGRSRPRRNWCG
jgi:hypothetical protein